MNAIDRAARDLERGEHWLARQRLNSYLTVKGYDPEVLAQLGEICSQMHDSYGAGRMWLTSTAEGEHVDRAISVFLEYSGRDPRQAVSQVPKRARLASLSTYPPVVRDRLQRLGLAEAIVESDRKNTHDAGKLGWKGRILVTCLLLFLGFSLFCTCVGFERIMSWIFGGD